MPTMGSETRPLHVFFFPLMAQGHLIPSTDVARLFAHRGAQVSIITTPLNAARIQPTVDRIRLSATHHVTMHLLQFPCAEVGFPEGCENLDSLTTPEQTTAFFLNALPLFQRPFEQLVELHRPDCIVSDMFFPWTTDVADKFGVPRLVFHGTSFFALSVGDSIGRYSPHESAATDKDPFLVPNLPHPIELTRSQLSDFSKSQTPLAEVIKRVNEADGRSYGVIANSFYELEPDYVKHYKEKVICSDRAWHIGPVSLCCRDQNDMAERGNKASLDPDDCLGWLGSRRPGSVVYVCFGSIGQFGGAQLMEIGRALEASGHPFIWVVRNADRMEEKWKPDGFEERTKEKGLIIRGWAPQVMILSHPAVGAFMTHCGWNSLLEGVTAGVPMVTWPLFAEQFFNENLITRLLRIGVGVGAHVCAKSNEKRDMIGSHAIERAVAQLMDGGDGGNGMRRRAKELSEMAHRAVEEGGSSYKDLSRLIEGLKMYGQDQIDKK